MPSMFRPRLWDCLATYDRPTFLADLTAGVTVGVVALPLAMAFGIASGLAPEAGLFTAIVAGFLISFLGGSRVQIGGPTGAFVVIVYATVEQVGVENLLVCTMMAGVILVVMGIARMGAMIKFIPYPVTIGFTNGIAVLIVLSQLKDVLGLPLEGVPVEFLPRVRTIARSIGDTDLPSLALAVGTVVLIRFWPRPVARRIPASILALLVGTGLVAWAGLEVETIGSRFGGIPQGLPPVRLPTIEWAALGALVPTASTIALLAAIESLLSAVVADGMTEDRHDSNQELIAQGVANVLSPVFGGFCATGAIARTATNVKSGGRTPVSGMIHALTLLAIVLVAAPLASDIPLAVLGGVLVMVAFNMGEWREFARLSRYPRSDAAVFLTTFALTVLFDLTLAVEIGMVLAAVLFIKRAAETTDVALVSEQNETEGLEHSILGKDVPPGVLVYRVFGTLFFGAARKLEDALRGMHQEPRVLILRLRTVPAVDSTALNALESLHEQLRRRGVVLVLSGASPRLLAVFERARFLDAIGRENSQPNIDDALTRARVIVGVGA